jgi:penicillin-binding protein 1C
MRRRAAWRICIGAAIAMASAAVLVPYPVDRLEPDDSTSLTIVDRHGAVLRDLPLRGGGRAHWTKLDRVASTVVLATIAGEDKRFFEHGGVDGWAVLRALALNLRDGRRVSGASTLSMQLVRLVEPRPRTPWSKIVEAVLAARLERTLTKQEILEQYLNRAYYGNGAFGIETAARLYFGRSAAALTAAEGTLLAVLPRAPRGYDPYRRLDAALRRRAHVLSLLVDRGLLSPAERAQIEATPLALRPRAPAPREAPHFVDWVLGSRAPRSGGRVETTLDLGLQRRLERAVARHVATRSDRGLEQAGVVVIDPSSGEVLAMVGSRDFSDPRGGQLNITTTPRHPGSALKPFVYGLALELGDTPATVAYDLLHVPSRYRPDRPMRQHGPVRYREALANSYNLAAVHVLERVSPAALLERLRAAGLRPLEGGAQGYGLALALGSGRVRLLDLAVAYGFLVNGGEVVSPAGVRGTTPSRTRVFSPEVSWLVMDMLADPGARRAAFGAELPVDLPFRAAVKTGTSSGYSDTVAIGATREAIVAAWAGAFDGKGTRGSLAMWSAAPLVRAGLLAVADGRPLTLPDRPPRIVARDVCRLSGHAPRAFCPAKREFFAAGTEPTARCSWHRMEGERLIVTLPAEIAHWAGRGLLATR